MQSVLICVTDSRGRGLKRHLEESTSIPGKTVVVERCIGGATLHKIFTAIREEAEKADRKYPTHKIVFILIGGICDLTKKNQRKFHEEITYPREEAPEKDIEKLQAIKTELDNIDAFCKEGYHLITTTIYPASLRASAEHLIHRGRLRASSVSHEELQKQQEHLEEDVQAINKHISDTAIGSLIVNLYQDLVRTTKKKLGRKRDYTKSKSTLNYNPLYDGKHPNNTLKETHFRKIEKACKYLITPSSKPIAEDTTDSQDTETEEPAWNDLKRQKYSVSQ